MRPIASLLAMLSLSVSVLALSSCERDIKPQPDMRAELDKIKGPDTGSIDKTMSTQAEQAISNHNFRRAAQMYRQLVDMYPDKKEYAVALADCQRRLGDSDAALRTIEPVVKKEPSNAPALEVKGLALMSVGEFAESTKTFDSVMNIDGKRWRTLNALGILFAMKKMNPEAIKYYNSALEVSPDNAGVLNNLGLALAMDKQYDKAIESLLRARRHVEAGSQELKHVDLDLALVYAIDGKLDEAEQVSSPHLSKAALYNNMGFYAYIAKNKELAKSYLNMALTQNPMYYERAWKNLSAVNGDVSSESNAEDTPPGDEFAKDRAKFSEEEKGKDAAPSVKSKPDAKTVDASDSAGDDTKAKKSVVPPAVSAKMIPEISVKAATDTVKPAVAAIPEKNFPVPADVKKQDVAKQDEASSPGIKPPDTLFVTPPQAVPPISVTAPATPQ